MSTYHILLIGIDAYAHNPLHGCVNDINAVERLLILAPGKAVTAGDVGRVLGGAGGGTSAADLLRPEDRDLGFDELMTEVERRLITERLKDSDWNVTETARLLKLSRSVLYKKLERLGLDREVK